MGATVSGSEIDEWKEPSKESYILCSTPDKYPKKSKKITIEFSKGEAKSYQDLIISTSSGMNFFSKITMFIG